MSWSVAIGVDTHRDTHVAVAKDRHGRELGSRSFTADANGYLGLWEWAQELGEPAFAIEGTGSYGAGLAYFLVSLGAAVYECERPRRTDRRKGKSDLIDAETAAKRLLSGEPMARVRGRGVREDLRLLLLERRGAVRARTQALNQLQAAALTAPDEQRERYRGKNGQQAAREAAKLQEQPYDTTLNGVMGRTAARALYLTKEIAEIDRELKTLVSKHAPTLLAETGVGVVCAAQLVVSSGDPTRMRSEAAFAALAGTSPVEASSGQHQRHRLNRGGDRQLNRALHVISLTRVRHHAPTARYDAKLRAEGKTPREARRCVKRQLARHFHRALQNINLTT